MGGTFLRLSANEPVYQELARGGTAGVLEMDRRQDCSRTTLLDESTAPVYEIDPLRDVRWSRFVARHRLASVFHTAGWLEALRRTYGYAPAALTTAPPQHELSDALVFCRVQSWLTGKRVVALPFSDHCAPLVDSSDDLGHLLSKLRSECDDGERTYIEIRLAGDQPRVPGFSESEKFHLHRIDLRPSQDEIFNRFHLSCVRRRITRAQRTDLVYQEGRSEALLQQFYRLATLTRRRLQLPPQPLKWFRNLIDCMGDCLKLRMLFSSGQPAAGILTLCHRKTMTYKYGVSDQRFHRLGSMQLLLWKAIQDAKAEGLREFDMGRSDWADEGLKEFKDRWGAERTTMVYLRYPEAKAQPRHVKLGMSIGRRFFSLAPDSILTTAGRFLYRHMA